MAGEKEFPKPLSKRTIASVKSRPASRDNVGQITQSVFVAGGDRPPKVEARVIPVERQSDGATHYEVRLEVDGVRLGERSSPPPLRATVVKEPIPRDKLGEFERHLAGFVPDHLAFEPAPQQLVKARRRIPLRLDARTRYNTTIFGGDDRRVFRDTTILGPRSGAAKPTSGLSAA